MDRRLSIQNLDIEADFVLLSGSPKINLDRFLLNHSPELIIADGSNYRSDIRRWQQSCDRLGISFHNTTDDGALILE